MGRLTNEHGESGISLSGLLVALILLGVLTLGVDIKHADGTVTHYAVTLNACAGDK